jgi:histidine triad (HIT) family protein
MTSTGKSEGCVFCKIAAGTLPAKPIWQNEQFIAIRDIAPQARIHLLIVPKEHHESIAHFPAGSPLYGGMMEAAVLVARQEGLLPGGFRLQVNTGREGGQTVFHAHLHVLKD